MSIKRLACHCGYGDIVKLQEDGLSWSRIQELVRMTKRELFLGDSVAEQFLEGLDGIKENLVFLIQIFFMRRISRIR